MKKLNEKHKAKFKTSWLKNPTLKDWIESIPNKSDKAYCKYCETTLYAHRFSIIKHATTLKHQENAERFRKKSNQLLDKNNIIIPTHHDENNENTLRVIDDSHTHSVITNEEDVNGFLVCANDVSNFTENVNSNLIEEQEQTEGSKEIYNNDLIEENNEDKSSIIMDIIDYDVENEVHWAENCSQYEEVSVPADQTKISKSMERKNTTISTHILDTTRGQPASSIPVILFRFENEIWKEISRSATDLDGRCPALIAKEEFTAGRYKIHFDVGIHLRETAKKFLYPFIEVVFDCEQGQHYHIPLLLNPFGYSTYRGS